MIYILIIAAGVGIGIYYSKKIDENYENGFYDDLYEDELEPFEEDMETINQEHDENTIEPETSFENPEDNVEESLEDEIKRLREENEELKRYQKGDE